MKTNLSLKDELLSAIRRIAAKFWAQVVGQSMRLQSVCYHADFGAKIGIRSRIGSRMLLSTILMLTVCIGNAWGTTSTWTSADEAITEKNGVTITMSNTAKGSYYQIFKSSSMVVEVSSGNITSISITCTVSGNTKYGPGGIPSGDGYSYDGYVGTWSGSASSVTLTASNNQVRITQIVVETSAGAVPAITISPTSVALGTVDIGDNNTGTFTVTGSNLKGNITLSGASAPMSLSSTTVTKAEAEAVGGKTITVTYTPTTTASINQTVTASSTDATSKTVTLTGQGQQKYAVHYYVNGVEQVGLKEMVVAEQTVSGLPDEEDITNCDESGHPYFVGWSTSNFGTRNTAPTTLVDGTEPITAETYYYAVFAAGTGGSVSTMSIDFESSTGSYTGWSWSNFTSSQSGSITAHGGSKYGTTNGQTTGYVKTTSKIASPTSLTVYVSKQSNNTTSSTWYIKVSSDGSTWTNVATKSATGMSAGTWQEFTADLSSYSNVYVELYYGGTSAVRNMDDLVLTSGTPPSYTEWITTCTACTADPTVGVAALKGSFNASGVGVTCPTTGTDVGSNCSWSDYGFIWSTSKSTTSTLVLNSDGTAPSGVTKVSVGSSGNASTFDGTIAPSPFNTGTYYYRAYGKNSKDGGAYVYSSSVSNFVARSVTFNLKGHGSSTPTTQIVKDGAKATNPGDPSADGWRFDGWYDNESFTGSAWNFGSNTVTSNITLYAKWTQVYTVTYVYGIGGSGSCEGGSYAAGASVTTCSTATKTASTLSKWIRSDNSAEINPGSSFTMPSENVTLTAKWIDTEYNLNYTGSNYTKTENKTKIKSGDTPLDLHFTCTGTYGFPSTISLSGGGQSWTAGTNYTWTVDESKQSATLHINELVISADMTIGITMKTRYTVTYDYPQGVIGSTPTTSVHYFVNGEAQTLKTVTGVSCGDYDTFEGWTTSANKITVEATSATGIMTGSYTATGNITLYAMYSHADAGATGYNKITEGVTAGTYIIATDKGSGTDYAYKATTSHVTATVVDGNIGSLPTGADEVTVTLGTGTNAGYFAIAYDDSGTPTYIYAYSGNGLSTTTTLSNTCYDWSLDTDPSTLGEIHSKGQTTRYLQSNNGGSGTGDFKGYAHTQAPAYLFKKGGKKYISTPSCVTPTEVTVSYDANGGGVGSITCSGATLDYGTYPALDEDYTICNTFNRAGYTLYKWHTRPGGTGGTDYDPGEVVGPTHTHTGFGGETVTLYAQWRKKVSFNIGNATGSVADVVDTDNDGNITLPDATGITAIACGAVPNSYTLIGWSESPVSDTHNAPTSGFYEIGATYPCTQSTLYAVYRGDRDESTDPNLFTLSNTTGSSETYYMAEPLKAGFASIDGDGEWNGSKSQFRGVADASQANAFGVENVAGKTYKLLYWMNGSTKYYIYLASSETSFSAKTESEMSSVSADDKRYYGWTENTSSGLVQYQNYMYNTRYLKRGDIDGTVTPKEAPFAAYTTSDGATWFTKGDASSVRYTYSSNPSCSDLVTITFNLHGGSFTGAKDADDYVDIEKNSTVQLPNAEWTRDDEWTFVGWTTTLVSLTEDASSITPLYEAGDDFTAINTTLHAVYEYTPTPPVFDGTVSGTWKIYGNVSGTNHYANTLDDEYSSTTYCLDATDFEFTNVGTNKYYIKDLSTDKYLQGKASDKNDILHTTTPVEWTVVSNGDGTWKVSDDRYSDRYLACGKISPWAIQNGASSQFGDKGSLVYIRFGGCANTEYASEPTLSPSITLGSTGVLTVTSTNGKTIKATNKLTVKATLYGEQTKLYLFSDVAGVGFLAADGSALSSDKTGSYIETNASGELATTNITLTYTPTATDDGMETATITVRDNASPSVQATATHVIKVRHLPADFVIAAKNPANNKWYALPANMSELSNPTPVEIAVDNIDNPAVAYTAASNIYNLYGQNTGGGGYFGSDGEKVKFGMKNNSNYPLFGSVTGNTTIKGDAGAIVTNNIGDKYMWTLTQTNASPLSAAEFKYTITCKSNTNPLKAWFARDEGPAWGLYASGESELRLIPASSIVFTEAEVVEWGQHGGVIEVDAQGINATSVVAHLGEANSSTVELSQTGTSVKGSATKYNYTVNFGNGINFADASSNGAMLTLEWKNGETVKAMSNIIVPKIVATSATMSSLMDTDDPWNTADVHVLPGVTLTANAGDFSSKDVVVDRLEIYPGATVTVTKGAQDVGTLKVRTLVLRNGWTRIGEKAYDVARLYVSSDANLAKNAIENVWYADWYIDYDQYYPIAVPWNVTVANMSYLNSTNAASAGVKLRYYDGESRADNGQTGVSSGANWKEYGADDNLPTPATLTPGIGYAMTAKRPTGKAFSIIRMPLTIPSAAWTTGGEQGSVTVDDVTTHKDQVSVTAHGDDNTPTYAKGWNLIANPYMSLYNGTLSYGENNAIEYANIPDINFQEYSQVPISSTTKLKPSSAFLVQAPITGTATFATGSRVAAAPSYRNAGTATTPTQKAYIVLADEQTEDMMGILVSEKYTADYELNADLEKLLSDGNTLRTYMRYNDMNMAYLAINSELAKELIPVAVRIPADGEYTFRIHEASIADELEGIYLTDYQTNTVTNLLYDSYTFNAVAGTDNVRFAINAVIGKREVPTGVDISDSDKDRPTKFIWNDKVYILHNNVIYDSTGKRVNVINK